MYRAIVVRRNPSVENGEWVLFDDVKYFFYLTNDAVSSGESLMIEANRRCHQENLIEQPKTVVEPLPALRLDLTPVRRAPPCPDKRICRGTADTR